MLHIKLLNEVTSMIVAGDKKQLIPCLSYNDYIYRRVLNEKTGFRENKRCEYKRFLVDRNGLFLTGFIPRVIEHCQNHRIPLQTIWPDYISDLKKYTPTKEYWHAAEQDLRNAGWDLYDHQKDILRTMFRSGRGVLHSPTASGKTVMFTAFLRALPPDTRALILTTGTDLIEQTIEKLSKVFPVDHIGCITGTVIQPSRITVSNIEKFHRLPASKFHDNINVIIVDECHHVGSFKGTWAKALTRMPNALYRFGFTATLPYSSEAIMALEGLVGPVIGTISMGELINAFILARPILKLIRVPYNHHVRELSSYEDVYFSGVVDNRARNRIILEEVQELADKGKTSLVMITKVEHGQLLEEMAQKRFKRLKIKYIHGASSREIRAKVKEELSNGTLDAAIASVIWKEGVDIPSLGAIINAAGGKYDIFPQQAMGRGLRISTGKTEVLLIDFFDSSHPYLIEHFGYRLTLYFDLGWVGENNYGNQESLSSQVVC